MATAEPERRSSVERLLSVFTEVRRGEGATALLLTGAIFVLLTAYYVIKPVREAFILVLRSGAEYKSYMAAVMAVALLFAVPAYSRFAARVPRNRLVVGVTLFFASHLVLFYLASGLAIVRENIGLVFYVWVGVFNMMVVAQFWAFANDVYTEDQGKRLFPMVGIGASVGAWFGSFASSQIIRNKEYIGEGVLYFLLLVAAMLLGVFAFLIQIVHRRESTADSVSASVPSATTTLKKPPPKPFQMVFKYRYLAYLAAFSLIFTWVNTNGEYILSKLVPAEAKRLEALGELGGLTVGEYIGQFYGDFFSVVNLLGLLLQMFVVSRLVRYAGLPVTFMILPVIALLDATAIAILPALWVVRIGKTAENATDYSINNTVRNMLWLPTTTEMKYNAKQAVDTFFVRMGDVASAVLVYLGAGLMGWGVRNFALSNIVLIILWIVCAQLILREQDPMRRIKQQLEEGEAAAP